MLFSYDIIGDIHGYASRLEKMLTKLGYQNKTGHFSHPFRKVVFLGDYIDRGPEIRNTLRIIKAVVDNGAGFAIMGNHEFNAIAFHTLTDENTWMRLHDENSIRQHIETLKQIAHPYPQEWNKYLHWFTTLPLALELPGIRVAHASWQAECVDFYQTNCADSCVSVLSSMVDPLTMAGKARERLLSGVKLRIPGSGPTPQYIRVKWWPNYQGATYEDMAFPSKNRPPDIPIPEQEWPYEGEGYSSNQPPVFIGHYRLPYKSAPSPLAPNIACLDYDVAHGGPLVGYCWDGEKVLSADKFVIS
jgi:hypothetical protein